MFTTKEKSDTELQLHGITLIQFLYFFVKQIFLIQLPDQFRFMTSPQHVFLHKKRTLKS